MTRRDALAALAGLALPGRPRMKDNFMYVFYSKGGVSIDFILEMFNIDPADPAFRRYAKMASFAPDAELRARLGQPTNFPTRPPSQEPADRLPPP